MSDTETQETAKAHAAYVEYCALGSSRSLPKLAKLNGENTEKTRTLQRQYEKWSSLYGWQERVKQYDTERAEERRHKQEAEVEAMNERHALIGTTQQAKAMKQIEVLIESKKFGSQAVVQLLKLGLDIERLARGDATDRQEITGKDGKALGGNSVVVYLPDNGRDRSEEEQP